MSVSAVSSSSSSYWQQMLARTKETASGGTGDSLASSLFGDLDSDGDGSMSLSESGLSQDLYNGLDTDSDGSISLAELQQALTAQRASMFANMQLNGQNLQGENQLQNMAQAQSADQTAATGKPNAQDMLAAIMSGQAPTPPPSGGAEQTRKGNPEDMVSSLFSDLDTDKSEGISLDESGLSQTVFNSMDTDGDGTVSVNELNTALEKQRAAMGGSTAGQGSNALNKATMAQSFLTALANNAYQAASQSGAAQQGLEAVV